MYIDQNSRDKLMSGVRGIAAEERVTLVFVSHDRSLAKDFGRSDALSDINTVGEHN